MCGIFGFVGDADALKLSLEGIKALEYRGYDSSGVAALQEDGSLFICKRVGKISHLEEALARGHPYSHVALAHTRWATHGAPTEDNAHPHTDMLKQLALVHNGVIENYQTLKNKLMHEDAIRFSSETDTEVVCHLIACYLKKGEASKDLLSATVKAFSQLQGSYGIALIHKDFPDTIIAVAEKSPLIVGYDPIQKCTFVASDVPALMGRKLQLSYLQDGEIAYIVKGSSPLFYDRQGHKIVKKSVENHLSATVCSKGIFSHYMLKEIFEQEEVLKKLIIAHCDIQQGTLIFPEIDAISLDIPSLKHIVIVACGSSYHAGAIAAHYFQEIAGIDCRVEIASEYRYDSHPDLGETLFIALSQSGETADTLASLKIAKDNQKKVICLCNVEGSTITRLSDVTLFLLAGPERAVASTKTFTAQLCLLYLLSLYLAVKNKKITVSALKDRLIELKDLHEQLAHVLDGHRRVQTLAKKYVPFHDFYFLGRAVLYPTALEAALKAKEIAYKNAVGYPAGEMKHGPIALLDEKVATIVLCASKTLEQKIISNLRESRARGSPIIVFGFLSLSSDYKPYSDDVIYIPDVIDHLAPIVVTVAAQLFAYYMALEQGLDIDQPRNLAKSVTVE